MARYEREQVRITPWPTAPLPSPKVWRIRCRLQSDGWLVRGAGAPHLLAGLPEELVLRQLQDVDPTNRDEVCAFVSDNGEVQPGEVLGLKHFMPRTSRALSPAPPAAYVHADGAGAVLKVARAMTNHWIAHREHEAEIVEAWADESFSPADEDQAWAWFIECLHLGLRDLHPQVEVRLPGVDVPIGQPSVGLYSGMCGQLFNMIVEELPIRACANETCARRFIRQQGRSRKGISRTEGVIFCSSACAKAQSQREYRGRQRRQRT